MKFHGVYQLVQEPNIVALWGEDAFKAVLESPIKPDILLWHCAWYQGTLARMIKTKYKFHMLKKHGIYPLLVTNSYGEETLRKSLGIDGFKSSAYVFTDEKDYEIRNEGKKYDAIYAAQLESFKRIPLARDISKLYVMTYKRGTDKWDLHMEYPEMKSAEFNLEWVSTKQKSKLFSRSYVGLCLSKEEGPMLASLEYMLNGLPVVSTPSKGGRDEYYSKDYCLIVPAKAKAIKEGVEYLKSLKLDPFKIRNEAVSRLDHDRKCYSNHLCDVVLKRYNAELNSDLLIKNLFSDPKSNFIPLSDYQNFGQSIVTNIK